MPFPGEWFNETSAVRFPGENSLYLPSLGTLTKCSRSVKDSRPDFAVQDIGIAAQ
jgi:hypothetical protein